MSRAQIVTEINKRLPVPSWKRQLVATSNHLRLEMYCHSHIHSRVNNWDHLTFVANVYRKTWWFGDLLHFGAQVNNFDDLSFRWTLTLWSLRNVVWMIRFHVKQISRLLVSITETQLVVTVIISVQHCYRSRNHLRANCWPNVLLTQKKKAPPTKALKQPGREFN